ncbi:outer membrane protein assembly factor BamB family protein [Streptomyces sp. NBC_00385]|uniref:outer membrane protein assembly factor BamB family protein n=1 Tax=Streptomyces sp. NBC_00385 TaxID=2975733 RepID=UPI002DDAE2A2|nr:PQQ-binding-like beta-propeller repeat protein [Streptomyces sp. NBC_00385]WRZ06019.1 PQQ-binding-like beta-propeller repeat protein [Streptomyces sp. NBC_00385]
MTQPPQPPPNDPPQGGFGAPQDQPPGGFGAPQDPPPGGFGAPTPPPADPFGKPPATPPPPAPGGYGTPPPAGPPPQQPGYGYPQGRPPQPGYGFPQTPPQGQPQQGYGFPPGQAPQQGYGYPTAPMQQPYQPQQPGGNGPKKFSTQAQIIVAAAVAVALIVGAGVWFASSGGDDDKKDEAVSSAGTTGENKGGSGSSLGGDGKEKAPADVKAHVGFQLPQPKVTDVTTVVGSWLTDKAYVKTGVNEIVAYDPAKGTKLWSIPLDGQVCAASRHMSKDFKTAIAFEEGKRTTANKYPSCNQVGALDLNTGKLMWNKSVTASTGGDRPVRFDEVTLSGSTVAAGGTEGGAAFDLNTGAERWKPKVSTDGCYDKGYGGGEALAVVRKCGTYDDPQLIIQALNPTSGAPLSSYKMPAGVDYASIVSTKPLVVAADVGDTAGDGSGISDFFSIDAASGKLLTRIAADGEKYAASCRATKVESCQHLAVGNNRVYVPTEEHEGTGEYGNTNEIVSFDLTTGKPTSDRADAGDRYSMFPVRMDGGNLIAYKEPPYDKGGQIVSIDGATFKQTVLMDNPGDESVRDAETSFSSDYAEYVYGGGKLFISETMVSKPRESSLNDKEYLVVSFSTN